MIKTFLKFLSVIGLVFALHLPATGQATDLDILIATELSGSAAVEGGLLIAEDELVGTVLFLLDKPTKICKNLKKDHCVIPLKIERKRKKVDHAKGRYKLMPIQDFEGIASDGGKDVFFIGSHNPKYHEEDDENYRRFGREFLILARLEKDKKKEEWELKLRGEYHGLLKALEAPFEEIGLDLFPNGKSGCSGDKKGKTLHPDIKLNIEGLAYHDDNLYIGFRAPLVPKTDKAIIAVIDAKAPFEKRKNPCKKDPKVKLMQVDLGGAGIRSLDWDSKKEKLLILSGVSDASEKAEDSTIPKLWEYEPSNGAPKEVCSFTKKPNQTPEGVSRWKDKMVMVFDDEGEKPSAKIRYLIEPTENGKACAFEPKQKEASGA